jgi:protein associated with RNAse G/E
MLFYYYSAPVKGKYDMESFTAHIIKSFKHDGHLHRMWLENWLVPEQHLAPEHRDESMLILINSQTKIVEADGKEWVSRIPGISFFIPKQWFNVVALLEENGVRYYCNVASPPYLNGRVITYIDYDLDVIRQTGGQVHVVDQEEYERHKISYHYSDVVDGKVKAGLARLLERIHEGKAPFQEEQVIRYYKLWKDLGTGAE